MQHDDLDRSFGFLVTDVTRLLRKVFDGRVRSLGMTRSQWSVLAYLYRSDGITQSALADLLEIAKPSMARLLDRLEAAGWVQRRPDSKDRRAKRVFLTDKTRTVLVTMREIGLQTREDALANIPREDRERLIDMLIAIKTNLLNLAPAETPANGGAHAQRVNERPGKSRARAPRPSEGSR